MRIMQKKRSSEIIKLITASALSIAVFTAGFVGINNWAFAAVTNDVANIPIEQAAVALPAENLVLGDFESPDATIIIMPNDAHDPTENPLVMSPEDALQIGAQYIWQMFGESLDGKAVELFYARWYSNTRTYWIGQVYESPEVHEQKRVQLDEWQRLVNAAMGRDGTIPNEHPIWDNVPDWIQPIFSFTIDAVSGEWIDISQNFETPLSATTLRELRRLDVERATELRMNSLEPPEDIEYQKQIAMNFAERHFVNTEVVDVEFMTGHASQFDFDENGNLISTGRTLRFEVTDSTGRVAHIMFDEETGQLILFQTSLNDTIPGFWDQDVVVLTTDEDGNVVDRDGNIIVERDAVHEEGYVFAW